MDAETSAKIGLAEAMADTAMEEVAILKRVMAVLLRSASPDTLTAVKADMENFIAGLAPKTARSVERSWGKLLDRATQD
ncbi:hypothetical protein ACI2KH_06195 [Roseomonas mucosa]|uniref:hypothetical protein n=1 Tax=Roseomonas mucosa TaxID=207340 RepID=UPI00384F2223